MAYDRQIGALCVVILLVFGARYIQNAALNLGTGPWFNALPEVVKILMVGLAAGALVMGLRR